MKGFELLTAEEQIESLASCLAEVLEQYGLGSADSESINHDFNSTYKVTAASGERYALRINVNSTSSLENLRAEIFWVNSIRSVTVPKPVANASGEFVTFGWHEATGRKLPAVLYTWLDGEEPGDEPTSEQLFAIGAAMAKLHAEALALELPAGAELPDLSDFFWQENDLLLGESSELTDAEKARVAAVKAKVEQVIFELGQRDAKRLIHADLHPWNVMWHEGELAVFDFDDAGIGLPVQDLATALYYLDTPEQDAAMLEGYQSVAPLPEYSADQLALLLLQRRLILLSFLYESTNAEHREMIPKYKEETFRRLAKANL